MEYSKAFIEKFLGDTFSDICKRPLVSTLYWYMIDSKERITKRLDKFLKDQIDDPHTELVQVAKDMRKGTKNFDEVIVNILKYVKARTIYETDDKGFGMVEYWANAYETWKSRLGDCEDQNALIYVLAMLAGIPDGAIWSIIGNTASGGHYWNVYFSPKTGKWYSIDSTYYVDLKSIKERPVFKLDDKKYTSIWFIFNPDFIFKPK